MTSLISVNHVDPQDCMIIAFDLSGVAIWRAGNRTRRFLGVLKNRVKTVHDWWVCWAAA